MKILTNFTNSGINNSKRVCCEQIISESCISKYQFCLFEEKLCEHQIELYDPVTMCFNIFFTGYIMCDTKESGSP